MIASTLTVLGAGIAAAWKFAWRAAHADGVSAALDAPARAPGRHEGIDIGHRDQQPGHPLVACIDGVLVEQEILAPNQGNAGVLQAADGRAYRYHHLADFEPGESVGDVVTRGQAIGTMGRTGNPNVPHLHFEARRRGPIGTPIDPFPLLPLPLPGVAVI